MSKRPSSEREEVFSKRQKNQIPIVLKRNKEIRSKTFKNTHRSFSTEFQTNTLCLHPTKQLIAIEGISRIWWQVNNYILIYTIEGYLVTKFKVQEYTRKIYFSDHIMITIFTGTAKSGLIIYNGYNAKYSYSVVLGPYVFDCGENEYLYLWESGYNRINIYSHDIQKIRTFTAYKSGTPIALKIKGDTMVVLNEEPQSDKKLTFASRLLGDNRNLTISRFSITNDELLESVNFNNKSIPFSRYICLDPLSNVVIANGSSKKLAVWYRGGRLRYYNTPEHDSTTLRGLEMTDDFQIIRTISYSSAIRVYKFEHSY